MAAKSKAKKSYKKAVGILREAKTKAAAKKAGKKYDRARKRAKGISETEAVQAQKKKPTPKHRVSKKDVAVARAKAYRSEIGTAGQMKSKPSASTTSKRKATAALHKTADELQHKRNVNKHRRKLRKMAAQKKKDASPFSGNRTKRGGSRGR